MFTQRSVILLILMATMTSLGGCASSGALPGAGPLDAVSELEVDRYLGRWYEIARYPTSFQKGLVGVTAEYSRRDDGRIQVVNRGRVETLDGAEKSARATAWVPDSEAPGKLKVEFFWPIAADYWVVALDPDYRWSVVGEPARRYLWILSREPELAPDVEAMIRQAITDAGYDDSRLQSTPQPPAG